MTHIAITFADQPDGKVDIQVYIDGAIQGQASPAEKLVRDMLQSAKAEHEVTDVEVKLQ